jgi:ribonuclease HII
MLLYGTLNGVRDSKQMTSNQRQYWAGEIKGLPQLGNRFASNAESIALDCAGYPPGYEPVAEALS